MKTIMLNSEELAIYLDDDIEARRKLLKRLQETAERMAEEIRDDVQFVVGANPVLVCHPGR